MGRGKAGLRLTHCGQRAGAGRPPGRARDTGDQAVVWLKHQVSHWLPQVLSARHEGASLAESQGLWRGAVPKVKGHQSQGASAFPETTEQKWPGLPQGHVVTFLMVVSWSNLIELKSKYNKLHMLKEYNLIGSGQVYSPLLSQTPSSAWPWPALACRECRVPHFP